MGRSAGQWRGALLLVCVLAVPALGGCGDDDGGGGEGTAGDTVTVKVGDLPIANVAPQYLGARKGFFREERITLEPSLLQTGNEVITSMISGDNQFGFVGYVPALVARSRGLPIVIVANADNGAETAEKEWTKVVVPADSSIRSVGDLAGKTIAVNSLKGVGEVVIKASLEEQGVDPSSIKLLEVGFPDMPAALERGAFDAAWVPEPFLTQVLGEGARSIDAPLTTLGELYPNGCYVTTEKYLEENPDVVEGFVRAMSRSLEYADTHPDEARSVITDFTEIPQPVVQKMLLPLWPSEIDRTQLEELAEYGKKYEVISADVTVDDAIWEGATTK
jgi:NitT/TauT family transport system substrate-binding protein